MRYNNACSHKKIESKKVVAWVWTFLFKKHGNQKRTSRGGNCVHKKLHTASISCRLQNDQLRHTLRSISMINCTNLCPSSVRVHLKKPLMKQRDPIRLNIFDAEQKKQQNTRIKFFRKKIKARHNDTSFDSFNAELNSIDPVP